MGKREGREGLEMRERLGVGRGGRTGMGEMQLMYKILFCRAVQAICYFTHLWTISLTEQSSNS